MATIEEFEEQQKQLSELIEVVEKDDIPTNIFDIEETDPLVLLGKINEIVAFLKTLQSLINSSDTKASTALNNSIQAIEKATEALNSALNNETRLTNVETLVNETRDIAQRALDAVVEGIGTKIIDTLGQSLDVAKFRGENGINVDMNEEDPQTFDIRLDETITQAIEQTHTKVEETSAKVTEHTEDIEEMSNILDNVENEVVNNLSPRMESVEESITELSPDVARALKIPLVAPTQFKIVCIDENNNQKLINIGSQLQIFAGTDLQFSNEIYNYIKNRIMLPSNTKISVSVAHQGYYRVPVNGYFTMQTYGNYQSIMSCDNATASNGYLLRSRSTRPQNGVLRDTIAVKQGQYVYCEFSGGTLQEAYFIPSQDFPIN